MMDRAPTERRRNMRLISSAIIVLLMIVVLIAVAFLYTNRVRTVELMIDEASQLTQYSPTFYEIYDKSTKDICNRLIVVQPFGWTILARFGKVFVINETPFHCQGGSTPAVEIEDATKRVYVTTDDEQYFQSVCLSVELQTLYTHYKSVGLPVYVPFHISQIQQEAGRFTVFDALNDLFSKYITLNNNDTDWVNTHNLRLNKVPLNKHMIKRKHHTETHHHVQHFSVHKKRKAHNSTENAVPDDQQHHNFHYRHQYPNASKFHDNHHYHTKVLDKDLTKIISLKPIYKT